VPQILAVIQVCLEGSLSKKHTRNSLDHGKRPFGDLIPWTIAQHFLDDDFSTLSGARVVRIAVHPDFQGMGYGSRAIRMLQHYYGGEIPCSKESDEDVDQQMDTLEDDAEFTLLEEQIEPKANLPPLLLNLNERRHESIDYLGVSFGLTLDLLKFWKKLQFVPVYLRQTANDLTGEHSCIMLRANMVVEGSSNIEKTWLEAYFNEFRHRFIPLLGFTFSHFTPHLALSLLHIKSMSCATSKGVTRAELAQMLSNKDLSRLSQYSKNMVDLSDVNDLLPAVASAYFNDNIPSEVQIDLRQAVVLMCVGLQKKDVDRTAKELGLPVQQARELLNKCIRRVSEYFDAVCKEALSAG